LEAKFDEKLKENEELLVRLQIKNGDGAGVSNMAGAKGELKTMKDRT